jgi:hypothetical protein
MYKIFSRIFMILVWVFLFTIASFGQELPNSPDVFSSSMDAVSVIPYAIHSPVKEPFLSNNLNRSLFAADLSTRIGDAVSTRYYEKRDLGHEVGEPAFIAHSYKTQLPVSIGTALVNEYIASKLWEHGHRRIARGFLIADIGIDGSTTVHNFTLKKEVKK